ncbi:MAG: lysophospholipid acyltransferase family protein [Verrucomicrobiota bacterium]
MIEARKIRWLERLFVWEVRRVMRRRFYGVYVRGLPELKRASAAARPLVICTNHSNWWDGFAAALTIPLFRERRLYLAQSETLLALYQPLRWLGAFGLDIHGSPLAGLRYALRLLKDQRNAIWMFPQGVLVPQWVPIAVKPGALWLARQSGALVLPVAFRYEWMVESRPSLFLHCGEALEPDASDEALARALQTLFDAIGPTLSPTVDLSGYHCLFKPRMSMNKIWERWTQRGPVEPGNE